MTRRPSPWALPLLALAVACDTSSSEPLPEGYNDAVTRAFTVHLGVGLTDDAGDLALVRALNGIDGSPQAPAGDTPLPLAQRAGAKVLRWPKGYGCAMTLDAVFPDAGADPALDSSYEIVALRDVATGLSARSIVPLWQAAYDIGQGTCQVRDGVGRGGRIGAVADWARAAAGTTLRLGKAIAPYYSDEAKAALAARRLKPGYVEFLPDALALAGYQAVGATGLFPVYREWRTALQEAFPPEGTPQVLAPAGPSLPATKATDFTDTDAPLGALLDLVAKDATLLPDVLTFLSQSATPEEHLALVQAARKWLDDRGHPEVQVGDTGLRIAPAAWESLATVHRTPAQRSAYLAAFAAMVRILGQDDLDLLVTDRWGGPRDGAAVAGEDLFQSADGEPLPAFLALQAFFRMDQDQAVRVQVSEGAPPGAAASALSAAAAADVPDAGAGSDLAAGAPPADGLPEGDTIRVMAGRTKAGGLTAVVVSLPPAVPARAGVRMRYQIDVLGVPVSPATWVLRRYVVDAGTRGFRGAVEQSDVAPSGGRLRIQRDITGPAIHQIELAPKP